MNVNLLNFTVMRFFLPILLTGAALLLTSMQSKAYAQARDFEIHERGMLHETVYNTGEIGKGLSWRGFNELRVPAMEWPGNSATVVEGIEYSGQHNGLGGGIWISTNPEGQPGPFNREYALSGGSGRGDIPQVPTGRWSFPISLEKQYNFPLLEDGSLNHNYDPNEAEEIITAKWATNVGVTVTRASRAWSHPDYDDFIIYEYTLEYTGDTDGNPSTVERTIPLHDVLISFVYGVGPSFYGYQRYYGEYTHKPGLVSQITGGNSRSDLKGWFDSDYWLLYSQDGETRSDTTKAGKPEPTKEIFREFAETGKNGGGLASPQATGFSILYYDTDHLAVVDHNNSERNESELVAYQTLRTDEDGNYFGLDERGHVKQPYVFRHEKVQTMPSRIKQNMFASVRDRQQVYRTGSDYEPPSPRWNGRGANNWKRAMRSAVRMVAFGPYTLEPGDEISFAVAEVVGFGGEEGKLVEGGHIADARQFNRAKGWHNRVVIDGEVMTEDYVADYGYPDYINSDVVSVQDVAHKAWEAYLGTSAEAPFWPEDSPEHGKYTIPVSVPAPKIEARNTSTGPVEVSWGRAVEQFTHPRLSGQLAKFRLYRSNAYIGPWTLVDSVEVGDVGDEGQYRIRDDDPSFKLGEEKYYAVTSVDEHGNESGKTNIIHHAKALRSVNELGDVRVVPNPFYVTSGYEGGDGSDRKIGFFGLPERATIRIYSFAGQRIQTIEHDDPTYSVTWIPITRNFQELASGVYYYVVTTPEGDQAKGKFLVIK